MDLTKGDLELIVEALEEMGSTSHLPPSYHHHDLLHRLYDELIVLEEVDKNLLDIEDYDDPDSD